MSNHGLRRMFSLLLAVMMVCILLPAAAFAAEGAEPPPAPTPAEIVAQEYVIGVECKSTDRTGNHHPTDDIKMIADSFTVGKVTASGDSYICPITVEAEKYISAFSTKKKADHILEPGAESSKTFNLTYISGGWYPVDGTFAFDVVCAPKAPDAPGDGDVRSLLAGAVTVRCSRSHSKFQANLLSGTYTVGGVAGDAESGYTCTVTITNPDAYVSDYSKTTGETHTRFSVTPEDAAVTLKYVDSKWTLPSGSGVTITASCSAAPKKPTNAEVEGVVPKRAVKISCLYSAHGSFDIRSLNEGKYEISDVTQENGDYYCTIKLDPLSHVSISPIVYHKLDPENQNPTIRLKYDTATEAWTVMTRTPVNITVICDYTVTYTDGVGGTAFADQVYSGLKSEVATPEFNGTPTRQGYIFDGWSPTVNSVVLWRDTYTAKWKLDSPAAPSEDDINTLLNGKVRIECTGVHTGKSKGLMPGTYATGSVVHDDDSGFTCTVTITNPDAYVSDYSNATGETHTLSSVTPQDAAITLKYVDGKWTLPGDGITITTSCSAFPEAPTKQEVEKLFSYCRIKLKCSSHGMGAYGCQLDEGDYRIGSVTKEGSDYYCTLELDLPSYVAGSTGKFIGSSAPHRLAPENQKNTFKLKYAKDLYGKWSIDGDYEIDVTVSCAYTVTYTDGVDGEEIFPDETADVIYGKATPAFTGGAPKRKGYVFAGWNPAVAPTVTGDVTYTARWEADVNGNGIADKDEETYTVTYTDGVGGKAFDDQTYGRLLSGTATPEFNGTPKRAGYTFGGWSPKVSKTVTGNVTYTATWKSTGKDKVPKTGDGGLALILGGMLLFSLSGMAVCVLDCRKKQGR